MLQANTLSSKVRTNLLNLPYFWQSPHLKPHDRSTKTIIETYFTDNMKTFFTICSLPCNFLTSYHNYYEIKTWRQVFTAEKKITLNYAKWVGAESILLVDLY